MPGLTKTCTKCGESKDSETAYYRRSLKAGGGREAFCKDYKREYYKRDRRWGHLRERYGVTKKDYHQRLASQAGACAICRRPSEDSLNGRLDVDHCHTTGEIRGLLCRKCNTALGLLGEDPSVLRAALIYLEGQ